LSCVGEARPGLGTKVNALQLALEAILDGLDLSLLDESQRAESKDEATRLLARVAYWHIVPHRCR
jgi:hypothetical protein